VWFEDVSTENVICDELSASSQSPFIFYVVFGVLLTVVLLTLVLFITGRRRRRAASVNGGVDGGARITARIRLVVVSGDRQRSPLTRLRRSTPATTPTGRSRVIADTPGPDMHDRKGNLLGSISGNDEHMRG